MSSEIKSPLTGSVWKLQIKEGDQVSAGQDVIILESMKMEFSVSADREGIVKQILIKEGDQVTEGDLLVLVS